MSLAAIAGGTIYLVLTRGKKWDEQPRVALAEGPDIPAGPQQSDAETEARDDRIV